MYVNVCKFSPQRFLKIQTLNVVLADLQIWPISIPSPNFYTYSFTCWQSHMTTDIETSTLHVKNTTQFKETQEIEEMALLNLRMLITG